MNSKVIQSNTHVAIVQYEAERYHLKVFVDCRAEDETRRVSTYLVSIRLDLILYSAVYKGLWVQTSCLILNYVLLHTCVA